MDIQSLALLAGLGFVILSLISARFFLTEELSSAPSLVAFAGIAVGSLAGIPLPLSVINEHDTIAVMILVASGTGPVAIGMLLAKARWSKKYLFGLG